jgi:hypothetical protein
MGDTPDVKELQYMESNSPKISQDHPAKGDGGEDCSRDRDDICVVPASYTVPASQWIRLCDDFVNMEGQCALLCELLVGLSRRETPLEPAARHGIDLFISQVKQQLTQVKLQLYGLRSHETR